MSVLVRKIKEFLLVTEGLAAVEYAVAGGIVTAGSVGAFVLLGGSVSERIELVARIVAQIT